MTPEGSKLKKKKHIELKLDIAKATGRSMVLSDVLLVCNNWSFLIHFQHSITFVASHAGSGYGTKSTLFVSNDCYSGNLITCSGHGFRNNMF